MGKFKGEVLSLGEMMRRSNEEPAGLDEPAAIHHGVGVRHTVAGNARHAAELLREGESTAAVWRFGVLQTLDDYTSTVRRGGVKLGASVFTPEPLQTGDAGIDAAFAALADHLAERDGWPVPAWAVEPSRVVTPIWYPAVPTIFREEAERDSPRAFRQRGILITKRSLLRA